MSGLPTSQHAGVAPPAAWPGGRTLALVALLGVAHMVIDGACNFALPRIYADPRMVDSTAWWLVVTYNLLAFATQFAFGWSADALGRYRAIAVSGCLMTAAGTAVCSVAPTWSIVLCGLGNSLFHVGAGAIVLSLAGGWAALAGLFVGPGDIGVLVGTNVGRGIWPGGAAPFILVCLAAALPVLAAGERPRTQPRTQPQPAEPRARWDGRLLLVLVLMSLAVALRSVMGTWLGSVGVVTPAVVAGMYLAACGAKCAGGFLADRFGWMLIAVGGAAAALPFFAVGPNSGWGHVAAMALVQLPMGVTLAAISRLFPTRPAFAFGLTTLWVYLGSPPFGDHLVYPALPGLACGLQAACAVLLLAALALLGAPQRRGNEVRDSGAAKPRPKRDLAADERR